MLTGGWRKSLEVVDFDEGIVSPTIIFRPLIVSLLAPQAAQYARHQRQAGRSLLDEKAPKLAKPGTRHRELLRCERTVIDIAFHAKLGQGHTQRQPGRLVTREDAIPAPGAGDILP